MTDGADDETRFAVATLRPSPLALTALIESARDDDRA
jgi:hypothetical protein